jgi:hypothetical protein
MSREPWTSGGSRTAPNCKARYFALRRDGFARLMLEREAQLEAPTGHNNSRSIDEHVCRRHQRSRGLPRMRIQATESEGVEVDTKVS